MNPQALRSGYAGKTQAQRNQHQRTPSFILDPIREAWGGTIALDPCASRNKRHWFAACNFTSGGLRKPWEDRTFVNPPFYELMNWLEACCEESRHGHRIQLIGPWKSHRRGFFDHLDSIEVTFLKAFPFCGQSDSAPFPCFVAAWNCVSPSFGDYERGRGFLRASQPYDWR